MKPGRNSVQEQVPEQGAQSTVHDEDVLRHLVVTAHRMFPECGKDDSNRMYHGFDPFRSEVLNDPYRYYERLRDTSPCYLVRSPPYEFFAVARYADVCAVAKNPTVFSSTGGVGPGWAQHPMMSMYDPPTDHGRLRRAVQCFFAPSALAGMGARVEAETRRLLGPALQTRTFDGYRDLGLPIALGLLCELLGLPRDRDEDIKRWTDATTDDLAGGLSEARQGEARREIGEFIDYLRSLINLRRRDGLKDGMLARLVEAHDSGALTARELYAMCVLLLAAGYGTTANGIANMLAALAQHPSEWQKVRADPALIPRAVEESVRWDGPVQSFFRNTLQDTRIGNVPVPKGAKVMLIFASANRDERRFTDPNRYLVERNSEGHVAFGHGIHFCLGGPLARIAMAAILRTLVSLVESLCPLAPCERRNNVIFRQVVRLPIAITPK